MWPSTTTRASASPPSCPIRPTNRPPASSTWPGALRPLRLLASSACSPTTVPATAASRSAQTLRQHNIKHRFTRPYTPRTNGKAERFIQTALREWAYARSYQNSAERQQQLQLWLHDYNFHRPHASLNLNSPASRAGLNRNNLLTLHTYAPYSLLPIPCSSVSPATLFPCAPLLP